ncbi:hypoxanthine phosphoribosyltransferase [Chloroflexota bacterium]
MDAQIERCVLFSRAEIEAAVTRLAAEITRDYHDRSPVLVGALKGTFMFMADLVRLLDFPLEVEFVRLSSYGRDIQSSRKVKLEHGLRSSVSGRDVLIIEDIVDTGLTVVFLQDYLQEKQAGSVRLCALAAKPSRREVRVTIDYLGFTVPDKFLFGYGLDYDEKFRNLPDIYVLD